MKTQSFEKINKNTKLNIRFVTKEDEPLLLDWANDPLVRKNAFNIEMISASVHRQWFYSRLNDKKNCKFYIAENEEGVPVGQVRLDKKFDKWYINFSLANFFRGKKIGSVLLETVFDKFKDKEKIEFIAVVKQGNVASCRVFEKIGFIRTQTDINKIVFFYNMKKNFMVVGGGFGQIPAILAAKSLGLNVIAVDRDSDGVMKSYKISEDLKNHPNIIEWEVTSGPGDTVSCLRKGTDRIGKVVVKGNNSKEALNLARDFNLAFKLDVYKNEKSQ